MATTETILVLAEELRQQYFPQMSFTALPPFYKHPDYIRVLSNSIQEYLQDKEWEHLLFSYHVYRNVISANQISQNRTVKWMENVVKPTLQPMSFVTAISAMKPLNK